MASILAELQKFVTPALVSEVSRHTHEPNASVHRAYGAAIPALAAIIANRSHDPDFMSHLVDLAISASADRDPEMSAMRLASSPTGIDTTTPMGKLAFQVTGAFAEFERSMIRQRVKAGLKRAVAQGVKLGRPKIDSTTEHKVRKQLAKGVGILKVAKSLGIGTGTVQRIANELR